MLKLKLQKQTLEKLVLCIFGIIFILCILILFTRKSVNINLMKSISLDENSVVSEFVSKSENMVHYESDQTNNASVDFDGSTETFHADIGHLKYGVYMIRAEYKTSYDTFQKLNSPICTFTLGGKNSEQFMYEVIKLYEYKTWVESPIWVTSISGADDLHLNINYTGYGYCDISSITIYEYNPWKIGFLILLLFIIIFVVTLFYKLYHADIKTRLTWLFLGSFVIFSSLLCAIGENRTVTGDDFNFHISRIASMVNEIRYGHIPALYQSDAMGGFGYISLVMYGNIFLYIPAFLHLLGMPLSVSYNVYIVIVNCVTCLICQYSFKRIFQKNRYAVLATALYLLSAYRIINIYIRTAVGEYTAMAFLPLMFYGFYRIYFEKDKVTFKDMLPLIAGVSGIMESHVLTMEMSVLFVGLFAFIHLRKTIKNLIPLLQALLTVIGINLFFIVPFLDTYRQELNINSYELSGNITNSLYGLSQIFGFWIYKESRVIGFSLVIGIILFLTVCICKRDLGFDKKETDVHKLAVECFLYGLLSTWIASCYFPGKELAGKKNILLKMFTSVQFSSRYLLFATLFLTVSTVYAVKKISESALRIKGISNAFIAMAAGLISICIVVDGDCYSEIMESEDLDRVLSRMNITADGLYLPEGMGYYELPATTVTVYPENACFVEKRGTTRANDKVFYIQETLSECTVSLPVIYYDYMTAYDSLTGKKLHTEKGTDGRLTIRLEKGYSGEIVVSYEVRGLWKVSYVISFLFCIGAVIVFLKRKEFVVYKIE